MTPITRPTAVPTPHCTLDRHRPGQAVGWQYWNTAAQEWQWITGTVVSHRSDQRLIEIRVDATNRTVLRPCGPIMAAPEMAR